MLVNTLESEQGRLTFLKLKEELREILGNPDKLEALKSYFEDNRDNGLYNFSGLDCDNELCRTAAIINHIIFPSSVSDSGLFTDMSPGYSIQCKLNAFQKTPFRADRLKFIPREDVNDTCVLAVEGGRYPEIKMERIENLGLEEYITVTKLSTSTGDTSQQSL